MKTTKSPEALGKGLSKPEREGFLAQDGEKKDLHDFGQYLRREREMRGISLEEVSRVTRINRRYLVALEEGQQDILPALPFVKGFITAYTKHLGLDPDEALSYYDEVRGYQHKEPQESAPEESPVRRKRLLWGLLALAGLAAVLAILLTGRFLGTPPEPQAPPRPVEESRPSLGTSQPSVEEVPEEAPAVPTPPVPEKGGVELVLEASDKSWVRAVLDEQSVKDFFLQPGEKTTLTALRVINLTLGSAGAVSVTFNGQNRGTLGKPGEVVRDVLFTWDPQHGAQIKNPFSPPEEAGQ